MKDIESIGDIRLFVDEFYEKVRNDELIGPIFLEKIEDWQHHLEKLYAFWNGALLGVPGFRGNPFARHAPLKIGPKHFDRWLKLFNETIDGNFEGDMATNAKNRAELMAFMFLSRLQKMEGGSDKVIV
jgi:Truncated hemoglobins